MRPRDPLLLVMLGFVLGVLLVVVGGVVGGYLGNNGPPPVCHCVVLTHPFYGCDEAVQGGYICP